MKYFAIIFLLPIFLYSQNKVVDSLYIELKKAKHDTTKLLLEYTMEEMKQNMRAGYWDSLAKRAHKIGFSVVEVSALNNAGYIYSDLGDTSMAFAFYKKSYDLSKRVNDKSGMATALNNSANIYHKAGKATIALNYYLQSIELLKQSNNKLNLTAALDNIAIINKELGNIPLALEYYFKSLKIKEGLGDELALAESYRYLGITYDALLNHEQAITYLEKSLIMYRKIKNEKGVAFVLSNIAGILKDQGKFAKSEKYYNESYSIAEKVNSKQGMATVLNNIGLLHYAQNNFVSASQTLRKALELYEKLNDSGGKILCLSNLAASLAKLGKNKEALVYAERSYSLAVEYGYIQFIRSPSFILSGVYEKCGNWKKALELKEVYIKLNDSLNNAAAKKAGIKKQFEYEYEKKAAADSVKNAEQQKVKDAQLLAQNASLKSEKTQRFALYGGLILVVGFLIFVFNRFRVTQQQKKIIEAQKHLVDEAFEKLAEKNKEVIDSITYARRIQRALITNEKYIARKLKSLRS